MTTTEPKTIDILILESLARGGRHTYTALARTWGEDRAKVQEWLERFRRQGLCTCEPLFPPIELPPGCLNVWVYVGNKARIAEYLASKNHGEVS